MIGFTYLILTLLAVIIISYLFYFDRKIKYWKNIGVNSPTNGIWTFLSELRATVKRPMHELQMEYYKKYGRIFGGYMLTKPQLLVAEPRVIKQILVKDFNKFHNRMEFKTGEDSMDKMLSVLADDDWKRIRCIMSPTFSSGRMRKMAYLVSECAENFAKHFEKIADKGDPIDCKKYLSNYVIDVIASAAFGTKLDSLDDPNNKFVTNARKAFNQDASFLNLLVFIIPSIMKLFRINVFGEDVFQYFRNFALHVIEKRDERKIRGNDFLQLMIDAQRGVLEKTQEDIQEEKENGEISSIGMLPKHKTMSIEEMLAQCILFLFAGSETTASTLAFFVYYMALYPDCQEKLTKEIDEAWEKHEQMNFDVFSQMPYLDAALNEVLRMQPVGPQLFRECTEDCELEGTGIKALKGMAIGVPIYAMHHDPEFFPNPEVFDPERFLPENRKSIPQYAYLPFGDGPRNCIGLRFAVMVMKMFIVHLFRHLRIQATEETKKPLEFYKGQAILQAKKTVIKMERRQH